MMDRLMEVSEELSINATPVELIVVFLFITLLIIESFMGIGWIFKNKKK